MCSIFIATPTYTRHQTIILGKNMDGLANEGQALVRIPALHAPENYLTCTHIQIPQAQRTFEILLSRNSQHWGGEMGINEHQVAIACQEVESKVKRGSKSTGLTGPDLVRLALERSTTAQTAMEVITGLIAEFKQTGSNNKAQNTFLIADRKDAFLLETVEKEWAALTIHGFHALSNTFTIEKNFDYSSKNLVEFAQKHKYIKKGDTFNFAKAFGPKSKNTIREQLLQKQAQKADGQFDIRNAITLLSTHHLDQGKFNPSKANYKCACRHATGRMNPYQTNASMVVELRTSQIATTWYTGTSNPCLSLYKPVYIPGNNLYEGLTQVPGPFKDESLWWQAEIFFREVSKNYKSAKALFEKERQQIQKEWLEKDQILLQNKNTKEEAFTELSKSCLHKHTKKLMEWQYHFRKSKLKNGQFSPLYNYYLDSLNKKVVSLI
ncbi:C69 family dipeptidase [Rapidithrix thailandica]|uniref:Dipeptidase n=1 Tax=Rapidithrix thailandica TaxID=413964 RepID=A0AAW9SDS9_9BACT